MPNGRKAASGAVVAAIIIITIVGLFGVYYLVHGGLRFKGLLEPIRLVFRFVRRHLT